MPEEVSLDHQWVRHTMELVELDGQGNVVRVLGETRMLMGCNKCDLEFGQADGAPCMGDMVQIDEVEGG